MSKSQCLTIVLKHEKAFTVFGSFETPKKHEALVFEVVSESERYWNQSVFFA